MRWQNTEKTTHVPLRRDTEEPSNSAFRVVMFERVKRRDDVERAIADLEAAHAVYDASLGAENLGTLRCGALLSWLRALAADAPVGADAAFADAAACYGAMIAPGHVVHAELNWMRAALERRCGREASALSLEAAARRDWARAMGREFQPPLTVLH